MNTRRAGDALSMLAVNRGSSSVRFSVYGVSEKLTLRFEGKLDRVGRAGTNLSFRSLVTGQTHTRPTGHSDGPSMLRLMLEVLEQQKEFTSIVAVGHRVAHGFDHMEPRMVTEELLEELEALIPYAPEHLPQELEIIRQMGQLCPGLPQILCFDTSFHRDLPRPARLLPIPRHYESRGLRRYGFHGLSYSYLMGQLRREEGDKAAAGRVILAHLGSGSSMAAVREGKCIDTSMGLTPASGLVMGTRSGDIDPGLIPCLVQTGEMTVAQCAHLLNHSSGLLGISETSPDMRDLLELERHDVRAAEAVELFCQQAKKCIGAFSAVLGGLDTLIFSGGIGEHCPSIRSRICSGLEFLGLNLDALANENAHSTISASDSRVVVRAVPTDENLIIARLVLTVINLR